MRGLFSLVLRTRENTSPQLCNILPYCMETSVIRYIHIILFIYIRIDNYCTCTLQTGRFACTFNELQAVGLFLAFDGASTRTDPFTSGKKDHKLLNSAIFIRNESLFFVSAVATGAFQLEHTPRLLRSECPGGYQIRTIKYGKILVMLVYGASIRGI